MEDNESIGRARALADEIVRHARANDHVALLKIDADPQAKKLLESLPEGQSHQIEAHLNDARIWRARQTEKARRKFDAASKALDELDLTLARGILRKIDASVLEPPEMDRYDELLLAVEARAVELEDIEEGLPQLPPDNKRGRRRRFRKG